jgi:hypothetical protein
MAISDANRYMRIIERVFLSRYTTGAQTVPFDREDIVRVARELRMTLPKNLGDVIYAFRYRATLPRSIVSRAPKGKNWIIRAAGRGKYCFVARQTVEIRPAPMLAQTKVPNATPGVIEMYALSDEQALLAKLRYNRLIDIFTGVTCYSLQSHLRTAIPGLGQVETDELYVGVDRRGVHYILPVRAKSGNDRLSIVQIEQDFALCAAKFPSLIPRPIAAQFMKDDLIAMFEFEMTAGQIAISREHHYSLVPAEDLSEEDLASYRNRAGEQGLT